MPKKSIQSNTNSVLLDYIMSVDMRTLAIQGAVGEILHKNPEQRDAFHADVERRFKICYEEALKLGEVSEPEYVARLRALSQKSKER